MKKSILASALALTFGSQALASNYALLSETRDQIQYPEYTQQEKLTVVNQAKQLLEGLYVHRYAKDIYYGISPTGHVNPVDAINDVIADLDSLNSQQLNERLTKIFKAQRDLHLVYVHPTPVRNFASILPFEFGKTVDVLGNPEVRVSNLLENLIPYVGGVRLPEVGDKVVSYNGVSIYDVVEQNLNAGFGANPDAGFVRALGAITYKGHAISLVPQENEVTIEFVSHATGETYTTVVPWVARLPRTSAATGNTNALTESVSDSTNLEAQMFAEIKAELDENNAAPFTTTPTADSEISWAIRNVDGQSVGYIQLDSFSPSATKEDAVWIVSSLMQNELANTDALVFDVRNNPGGNIIYADELVQLFSAKQTRPTELRFINSDINHHLMNETIFSTLGENWVNVLADVAGTNAQYTATSTYVTKAQNNNFGQSYYKPVGVWSNAKTYSSGDVFTCAVQDNGAAKVYGENLRTGAGGANVLRHSVFARFAGAPKFEHLPYNQEMTVSWRQMVRHSHNQNALIEDYGCVANQVVPRTLNSILDNDAGNFATIARDLLTQPQTASAVNFLQPRVSEFAETNGVFSIEVKNTEHVDVYLNNVKVERINVYAYGSEAQLVEFSLPEGTTQGNVQFVGLDAGNKPLWNGKRYFF
ncbi:S41 family peptidase [Pseudoalteromonas sp. SMS1]|uniref:S41 family peptidase n=1 Tax=Pseudoalteromonas sp. SMS1 TaxID=2908894 RepID=UPI001F322436|nr:S41 family peptidase [Pseudoalteromonas sp. SMS1]MCF2858690.1 S41 family peptidase [Pseudoalteromonas sp. SMS1]